MSRFEIIDPDKISSLKKGIEELLCKLEKEDGDPGAIAFAASKAIMSFSLQRCGDSKIIFANLLAALLDELDGELERESSDVNSSATEYH